jgi:hypothetical protein
MGIKRTRGSKAAKAAAGTPDQNPPEGDGGEPGDGDNEPDDDSTDDDDDDDDDDGAGDTDTPPEDETLESQRQLDEAERLALEEHKAAAAVREREINRQQSQGSGFVNYDEVRAKEDKARLAVRQKSMVKRGPGVYVVSPITTSDENGQRVDFPVGVRLPDAIVARFAANRVRGGFELDKLVNDEVLEDLRA